MLGAAPAHVRFASSIIAGELSTPTTLPCGTRRASSTVTLPSPQPMSSTRASGATRSRSITDNAQPNWPREFLA